MNLKVLVTDNLKTTISIVVSIITGLYQVLADNAEILGIPNKTIMIISFAITTITMIWNAISNGAGDTKVDRLFSYFK
tara:strand:+ start:184880 stop:185113 length:234 start_codon:yes stop_codon:yes gene_type:complete